MKSKTKEVRNWYELLEFLETVNHFKETLVLTGFTNEMQNGKLFTRSLFFSTKTIDILKEKKK